MITIKKKSMYLVQVANYGTTLPADYKTFPPIEGTKVLEFCNELLKTWDFVEIYGEQKTKF